MNELDLVTFVIENAPGSAVLVLFGFFGYRLATKMLGELVAIKTALADLRNTYAEHQEHSKLLRAAIRSLTEQLVEHRISSGNGHGGV